MRNFNSKFGSTALAPFNSAQVNLYNYQSGISNFNFLKKATLSSVVIYGLYQSLLTGFKTETLRKKGLISRYEQIQILTSSVATSISNGVTTTFLLGVLLLCFPWLSVPFSIVGVVGIGKASIEVFNAFWEGLELNQKEELLKASLEAGVNLRVFIKGKSSTSAFC
ncbi:hypothetical protein [Prochlorococcus sp. MIT 1341]|uniref:hypothetical protein n=1 Tax=Prochlorococcus sp. MIT 1341 TaxID=3096221 RepID=UPI002A75558E|nr:hypothetical protein [Prochlorococcus sp. MIT 1341]